MRTRLLAAAGVVALLGVAVPSAFAQEGGDRLVLRAVDASDREESQLVVSYGGDAGDLEETQVRVGGEEVAVEPLTLAEAGRTNDVVFVLDASEGTDANGLLSEAIPAITEFVTGLPEGTRAAIVSGTSVGQTHQRLTSDAGLLQEGLGDVANSSRGGVLDAVLLGAGLVEDGVDDGSIGTLVVITDGMQDERITLDRARGEVLESGAVVHVIGLEEDGFDASPFQTLAGDSGGSLTVLEAAGEIPSTVESLTPELTQLQAFGFTVADGTRGVLDLDVVAGESEVQGSFVAGGRLVGPNRLEPRPGVEPSGPSFLRSDSGRLLAIGGVLVASVLLAFAIGSVIVRDETALGAALRPYSDSYVADVDDGGTDQVVAQTALLRRAVEATESFAERQGFLTKIERTLEKADLPLRAGEALFFYVAAVLLVAVAALVLTGNPLGALVVTLIVGLIGPALLNFRANRKKKKFEALLPDTLQLLSSTLRAGYSMMQGVEAVSQEAEEPMGKELRRVVTEARLGRPLEESLEGIADRMESADFGWAVMAIRIQREVGGNLSELLLTVAETMTERERLRRDINALTAEGRISAYVLGGLPLGLGAAIYAINPDYMGKLFEETLGQILLGVAIVAMAAGFAWMFKIIKIEL